MKEKRIKGFTKAALIYGAVLTAMILLALLALLTACGGEPAPPSETETPSPEPSVIISELMSANKSTLMDASGAFPDWIELHNISAAPVELSGWTISDGGDSVPLPEQSLEPGEYTLLLCSKSGAGRSVRLGFSSKGEKLELKDGEGNIMDTVGFGAAEDDCSFVRGDNGELEACRFPTPGYENTDAGYELAQKERATPGLAINEVVVFNRLYPNHLEQYNDLIELKNNSDEPIDLGEYFLSDKKDGQNRYRLPDRSIIPGEIYTLECTDEVPFGLSSLREQCYLSREDGSIVDYVALHDIPAGGSMGRQPEQNGFFYFERASVGENNFGGSRMISSMPVSSQKGGVFEGEEPVTVELSGSGRIFYSLDGSTPDSESPEYTAPLSFDKTGVLRAVCIEEGKLPSRELTLSFIINEGHSLPVASLVIDPDYFSNRRTGIYYRPGEDLERPGNIEFFDGEDSFEIACGVKIHGATSRFAQEKKSYKLNFRAAYGGELKCDVFKNGVTEFSSILLRAAQESSFSTNMRDITMHELAMDCEPGLSTQAYRYAVLYINGEYWGIYALREAHSPEHFARHYGYDEDKVLMWKGKWDENSEAAEFCRFVMNNDMSDAENYRYASEHLDIDSIIAWGVIEAYSGNIDINSPNMRFYYTEEDQKLHYALVDLDLGLFMHGRFGLATENGYAFNRLISALLDNQDFRRLVLEKTSEYLSGPLAQDNAFAVMDKLADELRPELERDGALWGYTPKQWERELDGYLYRVLGSMGRDGYNLYFAETVRDRMGLSSQEFEQYFGNLG